MKPSTTTKTSRGIAPTKSFNTSKPATTQEPIEEPIAEVVMDDLKTTANEYVVNDANRLQDSEAPKTNKPSRDTWFKKPLRPLTRDPECNKHQVLNYHPEQPLFNHMVSSAKGPLIFEELMATPIDFSIPKQLGMRLWELNTWPLRFGVLQKWGMTKMLKRESRTRVKGISFGVSDEVLVSIEEVEELKNVKIKGEKKEAILTLRQKLVTMEILPEPTSNKLCVAARDDKWVPTKERVKTSTTNVRLETNMPQKEETFQVIIDVIENSTCYKAFTISAKVPEIFMQQFWYTVKKILDIYLRVQGVDFAKVLDDDATLTFLLSLGYKGLLHKHPIMYVDHMHQPWRTLASIINKCLSGKTASNDRQLKKGKRKNMPYTRLKFVRIGEDYQEYGLSIPKTMLIDKIKQSESYQMFFKYSTGQISPKKSRGKGSQGNKIAYTTEATVDVSKESDSKQLGKSISLTKAIEEEATRQVHVTHARIVTEPVPEPARRRPSGDNYVLEAQIKELVFHQEAIIGDTIISGTKVPVLDESTVFLAILSEETGTKPGVLDEENVTFKDNVILEWGSKPNSEYCKEEDEEHVQDDDEETDDEFVHGDEQVNENEDEEMTNAEVKESRNNDEEITDVAKVDAEKNKEIKDDTKKAELPLTSSSLSDTIDVVINSLLDIKIQSEVPHIQSPPILTVPVLVIFEPSVLTPIPKTPLVAPTKTLLPPPYVSTIPHVLRQTTTPIPSQPISTKAPTINTAIPESDALIAVQLRVAKFKNDVFELKKIDHSVEALTSIKSQRHTPDLIQKYSIKPALEPSKIQTPIIDLEPESEKSTLEIRKIKKEQVEKQTMPKYTIKYTNKASLKEYDQKSALYQTINENKTFNRSPANHELYHVFMEALIEDENAIDKGVIDTVKNHNRQHDDDNEDDDEVPSARPSQGLAPTKSFKAGKPANTQEPIEEPIAEVVMDNLKTTANEYVVNDANRLQDYKAPKTNKPSRDTWFKKPPRPLTPDPECRLTVAAEYFFNKDLEFLKSSDPEKKYTTSITKTKEARYEIMGIEDMVFTLWSTIKVGDIVDLIVALHMFTRSLIIKRQVEDLQLGFRDPQEQDQEKITCLINSRDQNQENNPFILKKWHPDENLLKEDVSTVPVWVKLHGVPVTAFSEDGLSDIATKLGTSLMLDSYTSDMCMQYWGRLSYARVMVELRANVELKHNIVVAMPKITSEGHYTCAGEKKTVKKSSQTSRGVLVGLKIGFKPQKEYRPVPQKPNGSSSGNKKKGVKPTIKFSNLNPFDVLNSGDNDGEFGKLRVLDNDGNPLVPMGIVECDSEVEVVFAETANLRISTSAKDGSDKVEVRSMGISFRTELQEKIVSRRLMIEHLEKVGATSGWLMRLNGDQEDDVLLLGLLDTFVHGMYKIVHKREKDARELDY
uniref:Uncharacterized protein n=1 Tax=Tanacetum cinerariifolium TaxID=118510 RepID=A0A6L2KSR4_TANCI|nr:hypothetical protein [Tanacetum cinerariifolium]